jgi:hypothetical protein
VRPELLFCALSVACLACEESPRTLTAPPPISLDVDAAVPTGDAAFIESARANLRFKRGRRLKNDLARALKLAPEAVCRELDQYDCVDRVHTVPLGEVEPYVRGIFDAPAQTGAPTPLAVDRVVLAACSAAVERDLTEGGEGLFVGVDRHTISPAAQADSVGALYRAALQRVPTEDEVAHLQRLYESLSARGAEPLGQTWATLSCFAVFTTVEALFY